MSKLTYWSTVIATIYFSGTNNVKVSRQYFNLDFGIQHPTEVSVQA